MKFRIGVLLALLSNSAFSADTLPVSRVKITGSSESLTADTVNAGGANRLQTNAAQSGTWTTARSWTLLNSTDSVNAVQSGSWTTGRTWTLLNSTDSVNAVQSGAWTTGRTWTLSNGSDSIAAVQSGAWTTGRTWTLSSGTDSVAAVQSGTWTVQQGSTPTSVANAWPVKLTDGTNTTAVKAASTAPLATDPAAVVVQSPNGNHATAANQQTEITALQIIDNLPHSNNSSLNQGVPVMGQLDDTSTGTVTEDNVSTVRITPKRALHTNLRDNSGNEIGIPTRTIRSTPQYQGSVARFDDMNVANGGVARGTSIASTTVYTTVYNYTGSGVFFGFVVSQQGNLTGADNINVKFEIDGVQVFVIDTADIGTNTIYNLTTDGDERSLGFSLTGATLKFVSPNHAGLYYGSSIKVSIKKSSSATGKLFQAGAVYLTKES